MPTGARAAAIVCAVAALVAACKKSPAPVADAARTTAADASQTPLPADPSPVGETRLQAVVHQAEAAAALPKEAKVSAGFVLIPAGRFQMGDTAAKADDAAKAAPSFEVSITRPFEIAATEVTLREFAKLKKPSAEQEATCAGVDDCPAAHVSWLQAADWCNELSKARGLPPCYAVSGEAIAWSGGVKCKGYRLPTEAEWEYAARAGNPGLRYGDADAISWYDENAQLKVHSVKRKRPNAWGLYDMLGNVAEWVWDWSAPYPATAQVDPTGPQTGDNRVFRGGSWRYTEAEATFGARSNYGSGNRVEFIGFRCVRTLGD